MCREIFDSMEVDRRRLSAVARPGKVRCLVGGRRRFVGGSGFAGRSGSRVVRALDQTSEVGRWRYRNKVTSGSEAWDAVFAEIVGALGSRLLPSAARRDKSLAQNSDLRFRHGIAIFVGDSAFHHRRSLQMNDKIFQFLARSERDHAAVSVAPVLIDFLIAGAFDKQM